MLEVFERGVLIDAMRLDKTIQSDAGQPQHLTQLWFCDAPGPEFFDREGFERPALQFGMNGFPAEVGSQFVVDLYGQIHYPTLRLTSALQMQLRKCKVVAVVPHRIRDMEPPKMALPPASRQTPRQQKTK